MPIEAAGAPPGKGGSQESVAYHSPDLARWGRLASCSNSRISGFVSGGAFHHKCPCLCAPGECVSQGVAQGKHCAGCLENLLTRSLQYLFALERDGFHVSALCHAYLAHGGYHDHGGLRLVVLGTLAQT